MNDNKEPTTTSGSEDLSKITAPELIGLINGHRPRAPKINTTQHSLHKVTASEIIGKYQNSTLEEISDETPAVISAEIVLLSAKLHEAASLELNAEQALSRKWAELRSETETDGQADKRIKATDEYADYKIASINSKTVIEVIRALKKLLQNKSDEFKSCGGY
jgi:hypothetical protein